jgi:NAD-dependent DNA ligase
MSPPHEIARLVKAVEEANRAYFNKEQGALISDDAYDALLDKLRAADPAHPLVNGEVVGARPEYDDGGKKVELPFCMGSLDKVKSGASPEEAAEVDRKLARWTHEYPGPYTISDKLDGVSALVVFDGIEPIKVYTRGDGRVGQDISHIVEHLRRVPIKPTKIGRTKSTGSSGMVSAVRGELVMSKENFAKYAASLPADQTAPSNARNTVSGAINSKHLHDRNCSRIAVTESRRKSKAAGVVNVIKRVDFVPYAVLYPCDMCHVDQMKYIEKELGCDRQGMVFYTECDVTELTSEKLTKRLEERRRKSSYDIDGLVVSSARLDKDQTNARERRLNPLNSFAFKSRTDDNVADTQVINVSWAVSKDGLIKPIVEFEPVNLSGVVIRKATGFNAEYVSKNCLGPGAVVRVTRSGDVIPHILEVLLPSRNETPQMPRGEERPGGYWTWTASGKDAILSSSSTPATSSSSSQTTHDPELGARLLTHFAEGVGIKGVSAGVVGKLYEGGIRTPRGLLFATKEQFSKVPGFATRSVDNLHSSIKAVLDRGILMMASNAFGRGFGAKKIQMVLDVFPDAVNDPPTRDQLAGLEGFHDITAKAFVSGLAAFRAFQEENEIPCVGAPKKKQSSPDSKDGPTVVFSGVRDADLEKQIVSLGGKVVGTVSKNTNFVIIPDGSSGEVNTGKTKKASDLGIPIVDLSAFRNRISQQ